jgi:hypothetical protein
VADDIPAEAVEAAAQALATARGDVGLYTDECYAGAHWNGSRDVYREDATTVLAAALPHLYAQWFAKVDAALRDQPSYERWARAVTEAENYRWHTPASLAAVRVADYLRDVLGGDGNKKGDD